MTRPRLLDPTRPVPPSRHPFQIWVLLACLVNGWVVLIKDPQTGFAQAVPATITVVWGLLLILASTVGILSAWWAERITGLLLERISLMALGLGTIAYGVFLLLSFGYVGAQAGGLTIAVGIASLWRVRHVNRELSVLIRLIHARDQE